MAVLHRFYCISKDSGNKKKYLNLLVTCTVCFLLWTDKRAKSVMFTVFSGIGSYVSYNFHVLQVIDHLTLKWIFAGLVKQK